MARPSETIPNGAVAEMRDMLHPGQRREPIVQRAIKLLRALRLEAAETRIHFEEEIVLDSQSGIEPGRFVGAADEQRGRREQRERECNLRDDQRIARQKTPAAPDDIFAGMFLQIADHTVARQFERWTEREGQRAEEAKSEGHRENRQIRPRVPDQVDREEVAHRQGEDLRSPQADHEPGRAAEEREEQSFGQQLPNDPPATAAEREANGDLFPPCGARARAACSRD